MKIIHSIIITFATCGIAFAEVNTVEDTSVSPNVMMVKLIDKKPVYTPSDVKKALTTTKGGVLLEGINPDGSRGYYGFGLDEK